MRRVYLEVTESMWEQLKDKANKNEYIRNAINSRLAIDDSTNEVSGVIEQDERNTERQSPIESACRYLF